MTEGTDDETKGIEQTQEGEAKSTQEQKEPTAGRTYTEEDFQRAVSKGLESIQRQLDLRNAETRKAESQLKSKEADLKAAQEDLAELKDLKLDDPEFRETYTSKKAIRDAQREVDRAKAELEDQRYETEMQQWKVRMDAKAIELAKETGIDINEFVGCHTEEEMEVKALRWEKANKPATKEEVKPPKFDSGAGSGGGGVPSLAELAKMSTKELKAKMDKIDQAHREGRLR